MENIRTNIQLSTHTTLGIGGPSKYFYEADSEDSLLKALKWSKDNNEKVFVLSGGSNVVISDLGWNGITVKLNFKKIQWNQDSIVTDAGIALDDLIKKTVKKKLSGIECLSGIPGYIGGGVIQNVGAYGQEISEIITKVHCINTKTFEKKIFTAEECNFEYRSSIFKGNNNWIITAVEIVLSETVKKLKYKGLIEAMEGKDITVSKIRETVLKIRKEKSMIYNKNDPNSISVGSFFTNPVVSRSVANKIPDVPKWEISGSKYKLAAAWLIEKAGFKKGYTSHNVGLSQKHALALINRKDANAKEVIDLAKNIQKKVKENFDVLITPEPVFVGFNKTENLPIGTHTI